MEKAIISKLVTALRKEKLRRTQDSDWEIIARPEQKMPSGNWFGWFIMAGRGFGKTRTGAETIKKLVLSGEYKRICLIGETYEQIRSVMIEGESGLLNIHPQFQKPTFWASRRELRWPNGAIAKCYSSENYEALRGPQFDLAWIDELAKFENDQEVWDQLNFCLRLGNQPKVIITTTPRPTKLIQQLAKRKDIHLTTGTTFDNAKNLPISFLETLKIEYANTTMAKQEIEGLIIEEDNASLWNYSSFEYKKPENLEKIIISVDPAITAKETSDETGIIVAGKQGDEYFILEDKSGKMNAHAWMHCVAELAQKYNCEKIIVETNQGGDFLLTSLRTFKALPWEGIRAKESKYARASSISLLYQQKKVFHTKKFEELETQLVKAHINYPDDRLDALVWALHELSKSKHIQQIADFSCWSL